MINIEDLIQSFSLVKKNAPLIHNITNYVVMNNTANALLAVGASPVMAHAIEEVADMVSISSALVLNIGTLEPRWVDAMLIAGNRANEKNIPLVFDPVGAGATAYRTAVSKRIIAECHPSIIRGNASEIMALTDSITQTKGVDSSNASDVAIDAAKVLARSANAVVAISGATDYITDGTHVACVKNGDPMMKRVTGLGCTSTAIVAAFAAVQPDRLKAATYGMAIMGIAGELATKKSRGNGSLQVCFLDELYNLDAETIRNTLKL